MIKRLVPILLLLCINSWAQAQSISDFSANYKVSLNGLSAGELKRILTTDENGVRTFNSQSQAKGVFAFFKPDLIEETSVWILEDNQIRPQSYVYQRTGGKKDKFLKLDFDWSNQLISVNDKKQSWSLDSEEYTLDKLIYQLALMRDLQRDKKELSYQVTDGEKLKTYNISILGMETILTPLGKIEAIKLKRIRNDEKARQTTLWCAPTLNYLPVRIEHIEKDGTTFTAELRRLKGIETAGLFTKRTTKIIADPR